MELHRPTAIHCTALLYISMLDVRKKHFVRKAQNLREISQKTLTPFKLTDPLTSAHLQANQSSPYNVKQVYDTDSPVLSSPSGCYFCCCSVLSCKLLFCLCLPSSTCYVVLLCTTGGLFTPGQSLMQVHQLAIKADPAVPTAMFSPSVNLLRLSMCM